MGELQGLVALVTGGSSGIGRAVVSAFLRERARVGVLDRNEANRAPGEHIVFVKGDVRSAADNKTAVDATLEAYGKLDILVANAGIYDSRQPFSAYSPQTLEAALAEIIDVNLKGPMLGALAALQALRQSRGSIIFTGSISGERAGFGGPVYVAAKHALHGLTRQLALELAPDVRVNAVAPGYAPTALRGLESLQQKRPSTRPSAELLPLEEIAAPDDYAQAYILLASRAGRKLATGTVLMLDGGLAVRGPNSSPKGG